MRVQKYKYSTNSTFDLVHWFVKISKQVNNLKLINTLQTFLICLAFAEWICLINFLRITPNIP